MSIPGQICRLVEISFSFSQAKWHGSQVSSSSPTWPPTTGIPRFATCQVIIKLFRKTSHLLAQFYGVDTFVSIYRWRDWDFNRIVGSRAIFQRDIEVTLTPVFGVKLQEPSVLVRVALSADGLPASRGCWEILYVLGNPLQCQRGSCKTRHHRDDAILDLPECEQVNMLTHSTPKWHFLTRGKTREKASVLALSPPKLRYGLNWKCNLNPFWHAIRVSGPSAELHRGWGRLDAAGTTPQSKENSEQIKTNHPMTGVKRNLLLWQQIGSDNKMNSHVWSSKNSLPFALPCYLDHSIKQCTDKTAENPIDLQENADKLESVWKGYHHSGGASDAICLYTQKHTHSHFSRKQQDRFKGIHTSA